MVRAKLNLGLSILLLTLVLSLSGCAAQVEKAPVKTVDAFVVVDDIAAARADIESAGGRIVHIFPEDKIMIGKIPYRFKSPHVDAVYYEGSKIKPTKGLVFYNAWIKSLQYNKLSVAEKMSMIPEGIPSNPGDDVVFDEEPVKLENLKSFNTKALPTGASLTDTSLYMIGDVSVGVITPESISGSETWTSEELSNVYSEIYIGLNWWSTLNPNARLTFVYDYLEQIPTIHEPIEELSTQRHYWGSEVLLHAGYGDGIAPVTDDAYDYINAMRINYDTDWGFIIFVVDSSEDIDGAFLSNDYAFTVMYSSGGGPYTVMTYDNKNYGIENMDSVIAHESGHIFGAIDQYGVCSCVDDVGYLNYQNQNCVNACLINENSIMKNVGTSFAEGIVDEYARGQIGWVDTDADGILDIVDLVDNTLITHLPDPEIDGNIFNYDGNGNTYFLPSPNPYYGDVSINKISNVQWSANLLNSSEIKLSWIDAEGIFNLPNVNYLFNVDTTNMLWGDWIFETKAISRFGDEVYDSDDLAIYGCIGGNLDPKQKGNVSNFDGTYNYEEDTCTGTGSNQYVIQYTCDGYDIVSTQTRCLYGCSDGRCLNKVLPTTRYYPAIALPCDRDGNCDSIL